MIGSKYKSWLLIILLAATIVPSIFDAATDGYRWQMIPVYISSVLLLGSVLLSAQPHLTMRKLTPHLTRLGCLGLAISAVLSYLYPVFALPAPTGRYAVGTTSISLVDTARIEQCATNNTANRELIVRVWYPTRVTEGEKATYFEDPRLVPSGKFSHLGLVKTNAIRDAAIAKADKPFPVVLYSPSWNGLKTDNTFQTEELASHGYVTFGLEHPCAASMAVYSDGRVIYGKWSADFTSSDAALAKLLRDGIEHLALRVADIKFVLNRLPELERQGKFQGTLDLNKIGIFGHSFGGAAAAQACALDARLKAGMNMDGFLFGTVAQTGAQQPFMFMNADYPRPTTADLTSSNGALRRSKQTDAWSFEQRERWFLNHGGYDLTLQDSAHMTFSDYPLRSRRDNGGGQISPDRSMRIINDYTVAFFDRHLQGKTSELLDRDFGSPFPEARFERHEAMMGAR